MIGLPRTATEATSHVATRRGNIGLDGHAEAVVNAEATVIGRRIRQIVVGMVIGTDLIGRGREKRIGSGSEVLRGTARRMLEAIAIGGQPPRRRQTPAIHLAKTVSAIVIGTEIVSGTASRDDPVTRRPGKHHRHRTAAEETVLPETGGPTTTLAASSSVPEMCVTVMPPRRPVQTSGARAAGGATAVLLGTALALETQGLGTPGLGTLGLGGTSTTDASERSPEEGRDEVRKAPTPLRGESDRGDRICLRSTRPRLRKLGVTTRAVVAALEGRTFSERPARELDGTCVPRHAGSGHICCQHTTTITPRGEEHPQRPVNRHFYFLSRQRV